MRLLNVTPDLTTVLHALEGATCWQAPRGYGTFITFDLGACVTKHGPWGAIVLQGHSRNPLED